MSVVNVAEEVVGGVLQAAEQLQGAVIAAETGCIESLRWAGAMPLLLRDLGVQNVLCASDLLNCASPQELRHLLLLEENENVCHVALLLSGFLWDYEAALKRLLALGVVHRLTVCSSLSERAHECYDFSKLGGDAALAATGARATKVMKFEEFTTEISKNVTFPVGNRAKSTAQQSGEDEDWDWNDAGTKTANHETADVQNGVQVVHLPLSVVPLLSTKTFSPEPSLFVLSRPTCASAFPLLLHQVEANSTASPASPTGRGGPGFSSVDGGKRYKHVKDVLPEHIPSAFRRSMRLLAYTLAEMLLGAQLDVKERIFAVGATSLKIGHTLLRILNELQEDTTPQMLQGQQTASMVIIDRTADLASPCSFGSSLLDRILALLPQTPTHTTSGEDTAQDSATKRPNVTEIFPLHGCEPTPLTIAAAFDASGYKPSEFVAQIQWKGGASLCHPTIPSGSNVFRSLAFRPAKLALRDLDKRLQAVEQTLLQQGKLETAAVTRRPGEKVRGRDVVLRRISKILEAGEPTNLEHSSLVELGVIVLEALERMDQSQSLWDKCHERAVRQLELCKQGGAEWILPEMADIMQRQVSAMQSKTAGDSEEFSPLQDLLTLLANAFALSAGTPVEDFTIQMVRKALVDSVVQAVQTTPLSVQAALPELFTQLSPLIRTSGAPAGHFTEHDTEGDNWDWNDGSSPTPSREASDSGSGIQLTEAKAVIETYVDSLMDPLKDCQQQFVKVSDTAAAKESPRSLLAQLCSSIVDPSSAAIPEMQHVVDASEQLTRAGIDLLKSGFSKFGFGGSGGGQRGTTSSRLLGDANVLVVFVVGGVTFEEIQEVHDVLSDNTKYQLILGGTTITNNQVILNKLFTV
ncbi:uncharacterized protein PITG_06220 [Phytophthora infestans T30-4]|uniref:Sec1 family domain-containing protein n=1 Tax=Phytophthora infestans (strain T30-4) TaxID=403677 RepID=D0N4C7_PHYIT|nr:uncharacterized protein PITG_06220 [Phytophthora infestans T30-4]EEY69735.1 conserved hypothetical protein [Phytophthora infestans T30-4]|eukprot:XP_002998382.1 conserved hypothetical protein [Phytophthora infestans T30-4]